MLRFGIFSVDEFRPVPLGAPRIVRMAFTSRRVSLQLLRTSQPASAAELRVFQSLVSNLRLSSGVYRTTYGGRFKDVDTAVNALLSKHFVLDSKLEVHDWAASDGLTSSEWAVSLFDLFPRASFTASDFLLFLVEAMLADGSLLILEPNGHPLQYVRRPFAVRLEPPEPILMIVNRLIGRKALARFKNLQLRIPSAWLESEEAELVTATATLRKLPLTHPHARMLEASDPRFSICHHSAFESLDRPVDVIRTMNIFNHAYFPPARLIEGARAVWKSLNAGGFWIVGRTTEEGDSRNHVTILERTDSGWRIGGRISGGSDIEDLILSAGTTWSH
jgi:hypothetical protein